jgi:hypothetical protein
VVNPSLKIGRWIVISRQILKECLKMETPAMKYTKVPEAIHNSLRILQRGTLLSLDLHQELPQLIRAHNAVLRVAIEDLLDLLRYLRGSEAETPPEAEAHPVGLFVHFDG